MHIVEENEKQYVKKIEATVEGLRKEGGGVKETTFWEFKRKLERRKEDHMIATRGKNRSPVESRKGILEIYQEFYSNLFKTKEAKTKEEEEIEEGIQIRLKRIEEKANKQKPLDVKIEEVEQTIKKLKLKKALDEEGWRNEMIKMGGREMVISIWMMFNKIFKDGIIPEQWEAMKIKSIYKNKGSKKEVTNRRGIFLTSVLSKLFEKILLLNTEKGLNISSYQSGGKKGQSTSDNWIVLKAILDNNKRVNKNTYLLLADAEKCFDKLCNKIA